MSFNLNHTLHELKHFLPAQAPLKDFIHHNTLHAFQNLDFFPALEKASKIFGTKTILSLSEFRELYRQNKIDDKVLSKVISERKGSRNLGFWKEKLLNENYSGEKSHRIGNLRKLWKQKYSLDVDLFTQPILFRTLSHYLDQGISIWGFPINKEGFLASIKSIERKSYVSFFNTKRAKELLFSKDLSIEGLLKILVGNPDYYEQYLFDQQFTHQGWSGMVSNLEDNPHTLFDPRKISLKEVIIFELLLEIDAVDQKFGTIWAPISHEITDPAMDLFSEVLKTELSEVLALWQEGYEWTYYDQVLTGIEITAHLDSPVQKESSEGVVSTDISFQALFCIDDRECSFRRYIEYFDPNCQTFGTPGFFGIEFYYQPENGNFYNKVCPAPVTPKFLIREINSEEKQENDVHFNKRSHSLMFGWLISSSLGFWSAIKLAINIFKPSLSPATSFSFRHMNQFSKLSIENKNNEHSEDGLQIGFTIDEMAVRVENLLKSIGLVKEFAPIVYVVGHGSTSVNNTHYAGYDCGACSGRPGSVNARVISAMANMPKVRTILASKGIHIPTNTQFIGALRDTTRDEIAFYDLESLSAENRLKHANNSKNFNISLDYNAKERSRRFESIDSKMSAKKIHEAVKIRSVSLFEPRPELNHATNALCVVGKRELTKNIFLDRRSFMNSFDASVDPEGKYLLGILNAVAPVCGGINLEYYFSRVDNQKYGAGTKLAHNVMGLFGVANGIDGDLRPGLPSQMVEVHDPIRLLVIVEHFPDVVLKTIQINPNTYEWFQNGWIHLVAVHPETKKLFRFEKGAFYSYITVENEIQELSNLSQMIESTMENIPVHQLTNFSL